VQNSWGLESGLGVEAFITDLGVVFTILNVYRPYEGRNPFWEALFHKSLLQIRVRPYPLSYFFRHALEVKGLTNLDPIKLAPTWKNNRVREDMIAKRIHWFLISDKIMERYFHIRQWVGCGGDSKHSPIFLEVAWEAKNPTSPSKFNLA
jgi:hypothetical protein